jgi:hypothetical protein
VDSTLLLKVAVDTLGDKNVLACISAGVVEPKHVLKRAKKIAKTLGVRLQTIDADELKDPHFVANKADRCFHCKSHLCQELIDIAGKKGFKYVVFGTNLDDLDDFRPGNRAMKLLSSAHRVKQNSQNDIAHQRSSASNRRCPSSPTSPHESPMDWISKTHIRSKKRKIFSERLALSSSASAITNQSPESRSIGRISKRLPPSRTALKSSKNSNPSASNTSPLTSRATAAAH